jgi:hypothetical protein
MEFLAIRVYRKRGVFFAIGVYAKGVFTRGFPYN